MCCSYILITDIASSVSISPDHLFFIFSPSRHFTSQLQEKKKHLHIIIKHTNSCMSTEQLSSFFVSSSFPLSPSSVSKISRNFSGVEKDMVSLETIQASSNSTELTSSPRLSFSADFLDERNFITISPNSQAEKKENKAAAEREKHRTAEFEFLSCNLADEDMMITADELFSEGKLLPFWQVHHSEKLNKISLKTEQPHQEGTDEGQAIKNNNSKKKEEEEEPRISWFLDDDPSPRPPKCTVLWKELLRLKKQRASSSLSPSSSTSSSSSSSLGDTSSSSAEESKDGAGNREKHVKRIKKGLERTRSASLRIRPMVNVPICSHQKHNALPPLFSLKKGRLER